MKPIIQYPRANEPLISYQVNTIAKRYGFPKISQQTQWIAVISLGGGFSKSDTALNCKRANVPLPPLRFVSVNGATNAFTGNSSGPDGENALDVQTIAIASEGQLGVIVYGAPNDGPAFAKAVKQVALDNIACSISLSWGQFEGGWADADRVSLNDALQACVDKDIIPFVASGDAGSSDGQPGNAVDFPSSSPYVFGCGGTHIVNDTTETAWSFGGGGLSKFYSKPDWQLIGGTARGIPDFAGNADPQSGYEIVVGGKVGTVGGTSAVAPLMAAGVGLVVSTLGRRLTFKEFATSIYKPGLLTDILSGSNGAWRSGPGWDAASGMGVPNAAFWQSFMGTTPTPPVQPPAPTITKIVIPVAGTYVLTA